MKFSFYPKHLHPEEEGDVETFIRKELQKRPDLRLLVNKFLDRIRKTESFEPFYQDETIEYLAGDEIYEMRIPKTRSGGVVRIYFVMHPQVDGLLVLLDAEIKHGKPGKRKGRAKERKKTFLSDLQRTSTDGTGRKGHC